LFPAQRGAGSGAGGKAGNAQERLALFQHLPTQLVGDAKARTLLIGAADVDADGLDLEIDAELLRVLAERVGQDLVVKPDHALAADLQTLALQHVPAARPQRHVVLVSPPTRLFLGGEGVEVRHAPAVWADIDNHPTIVGSIAERGAIRVVPINPLLDGDYVDNGGFIAQEPLGSLLADVVGESFRADARLGDHLVAKLIVAVEHAAAPVVDEPFDIMAQVVAVSLDLSRAPGNRVVLPPRRLVDHPLCDEASPILRAAEGHVGHGPFELIDLAPQVLRLLHEDADPLVDLSDTISRPRGNLLRVRSGRAALYGLQDTELALGLFGQLIKEGVEFLVDFRVTGLQPGPLAPITVRPPLLRPIALDFLDVEHALPVRRHAVLDPRVRHNIGHTLPVGRNERISVRVRSVERNQDLAVILPSGLGVTPVLGRAGGESCSDQVVLCLLPPSYGGPQLIEHRSGFWGRGALARLVPLPPNRLVALDLRPDFLREVERPNRVRMDQDGFDRSGSGP